MDGSGAAVGTHTSHPQMIDHMRPCLVEIRSILGRVRPNLGRNRRNVISLLHVSGVTCLSFGRCHSTLGPRRRGSRGVPFQPRVVRVLPKSRQISPNTVQIRYDLGQCARCLSDINRRDTKSRGFRAAVFSQTLVEFGPPSAENAPALIRDAPNFRPRTPGECWPKFDSCWPAIGRVRPSCAHNRASLARC